MKNSFIVLNRGGAMPIPFDIGGLGDDDPFAAIRRLAYRAEDGTAVGSVAFKGQCDIDSFPHWEVIIVSSGVLVFDIDAAKITVSAGGAVVVNRGARVRITAAETAIWMFCAAAYDKPVPSVPANLVLIDRQAALFPSSPPAPAVLLSTAPVACRAHEFFNRTDIGFSAGMWDSTPYTRKVVPHKNHELMFITQGSVTLTDGEGRSEQFSVGDTVFVPRGVPVSWRSEEHVAKVYCSRLTATN